MLFTPKKHPPGSLFIIQDTANYNNLKQVEIISYSPSGKFVKLFTDENCVWKEVENCYEILEELPGAGRGKKSDKTLLKG